MGTGRNSIIVKGPDRVWALLRDFHRFPWGQGIIETCERVGPLAGDQVGAQRLLNDTFQETLLELSDHDLRLRYRITDGPGTPVSKETVRNFVGTIQVRPVTADGTAFVEWISSFESDEDATVAAFCNPIYVGLLQGLQDHFA